MRVIPPLAGLALGASLLVGLSSCGEEDGIAVLAPPTDTGATAAAWWDGIYKQQKDRIPREKVTSPGEPWGQYVGSRACGTCHEEEYAKWKKSFHSRTLYDAVEGTVIGDFTQQTIDVPAVYKLGLERIDLPGAPFLAEVFTQRNEETGQLEYFMELWDRDPFPAHLPRDTYSVGNPGYRIPVVGKKKLLQKILWTFGNRRHQPYVARWRAAKGDDVNEGAYWTLPFFYNDAAKQWMYCGFRRYTDSCATCHTTGIKTSPIPWRGDQLSMGHTKTSPRVYNLRPPDEGWAEGAVGCENCHGPGLEHVRQVNAAGVTAYRELRKSGKKPPTIFPSTRASESLERLTQQCDSCHNFFTEASISFIPGPHGYGRNAFHDGLKPQEDPHHDQHFPDGSKKSPCSIGTVYRQSKMFKAGIACFDCHDPHGSDHFGSLKKPIHDNSLCIDCHVTLTEPAAQVAHSKHKGGSPGNRCVECHMPRHMVFTNGQQNMSDRIHNHILDVPRGGRRPDEPPTSCNICHTDRDEAWSAAEIKRLWPPEAKDASTGEVLRPDGPEAAPGSPPEVPPPAPPAGAPPPDAIPGRRDDERKPS